MLLDIGMRELNGLEVAARVTRDFPTVKTLILSMHNNEEYVLRALRIGPSGYMLKDSAITELKLAIETVLNNKIYLSPSISRSVIDSYLNRTAAPGKSTSLDKLTPRQREILQLIAEGRTSKDIALELGLSVKTADAHRANVMRKLDLHSVSELVRYAVRNNIVQA